MMNYIETGRGMSILALRVAISQTPGRLNHKPQKSYIVILNQKLKHEVYFRG